jgi:hypothetical protein
LELVTLCESIDSQFSQFLYSASVLTP